MSVVDSNKKTATRRPRSRKTAAEVPAQPAEIPAQAAMPLHFEHQSDKQHSFTGEAHEVRIVGNSLHDEHGREAAYYSAGTWRIGDERFRYVEFPTPVLLRLENAQQQSKVIGPLEHVRIIDGVVRFGADRQDHVARFDQPTRSWRLRDDQTLWQTLVLSPAPEPTPGS